MGLVCPVLVAAWEQTRGESRRNYEVQKPSIYDHAPIGREPVDQSAHRIKPLREKSRFRECQKRTPFAVSGSDAHREVTPLPVLSFRVRPELEPVASCTLDGHSIGGGACESG